MYAQSTLVFANDASQTFITDENDEKWKAYYGNITAKPGELLEEFIILDGLQALKGQFYATRTGNINWLDVGCSSPESIYTEDLALHRTDDSIAALFTDNAHTEFFSGNIQIQSNSCPSLRLASPELNFEEILLNNNRTGSVIYTAIFETQNRDTIDFNIIVPETYDVIVTHYYFYAELL